MPFLFDFEEDYLLQLELDKILSARKEKDIVEELLLKPEILEAELIKIKEPVSDFFRDKLDGMKEKINHLNADISSRFRLKQKFQTEIDYQIRECAFSLSNFHQWGLGYNVGVDMKRNLLERQLVTLRRERRNAELKAWDDIVNLRKELRAALDEYRNALRRYKMVE